MDRYIGLDVHAQSTTAVVMGPSGRRLQEQRLETSGKLLVQFVRGVAGRRHLCMEEGTQSEWLHELLEPHVAELVVVQPVKRRGSKSDSMDAWFLVDELRKGGIRGEVFKAPRRFTSLREAVRGYVALRGDVVRAKNRLNGLYRSRGVRGMGDEIYEAESRSKWLGKLPMHCRQLAELRSAELDVLVEVYGQAERWLLEEAGRTPEVRRLESVPGLGRIRAAQIVAVVVTPFRFRTKRQFWSYCGLGIVTRSSSDWVREHKGWVRKEVAQTRGLNRNRHPLLKEVFKGAATTVIHQMPRHPLHTDYEGMLETGTKPNLAKLTVARRIAAAVLAIWKKKEVYDPAKHRRQESA